MIMGRHQRTSGDRRIQLVQTVFDVPSLLLQIIKDMNSFRYNWKLSFIKGVLWAIENGNDMASPFNGEGLCVLIGCKNCVLQTPSWIHHYLLYPSVPFPVLPVVYNLSNEAPPFCDRHTHIFFAVRFCEKSRRHTLFLSSDDEFKVDNQICILYKRSRMKVDDNGRRNPFGSSFKTRMTH